MDSVASLRRLFVLSMASFGIAAETVVGELLFVGHIIFLVETLGFAWGLVVFTAIWAALGLAVLAVVDFLWPQLGPLFSRFTGRVAGLLGRAGVKTALVVLATSGVLAAAGAAFALAGSDIWGWLTDHRAGVATFIVVAVAGFPILLLVARIGPALKTWVRGIADTAGLAMRSFAALLSMVILGPALSWFLFRLLGFSDRSVYALTLVSAPVFGAVWVPFYALGVWGLIEGSL